MENILFKISYPAEFHAQTAVECALTLHSQVNNKLDQIEKIIVRTQEPAMRIISKKGPLHNPADRDHCLEYMIAIPLIYGELTAEHYEDTIASNEKIDFLRGKMQVTEDKQFSIDYLDPEKRSIANAIQIIFKDGTSTEEVVVEYPIGHKRRRIDGIPLLVNKFKMAMENHYSPEKATKIITLSLAEKSMLTMSISEWIEKLS